MFDNRTFADKMKGWDIYGKIQKGNLQKTFIGACISLFTIALSIYLIVFVFSKTFDIRSSSEMMVDLSKGSTKLKINIDITIKAIPCSLITLHNEDNVGEMLSQFTTIIKHRLDSYGNIIQRNIPLSQVHPNEYTDELYQKIKEELTVLKEGCLITGSLEVNRVPGALYFTSVPYQSIIYRIVQETNNSYHIDMSHKINHLSFGEKTDLEFIFTHFDAKTLDPLEGVSKTNNGKSCVFQYYLNIVPTKYTDINKKEYNANQYTAHNHIIEEGSMFPTIMFQYDISPIVVNHTQSRPRMFKTIVNICAIFGGLFTLTGMFDSFIHQLLTKTIKQN